MSIIIEDEDIPLSSRFVNKKNNHHLKGKICLGLCCINNGLRKFKDENGKKQEIFCSRGTPRSHFTVDRAKSLAIQNIQDISKLIDWNVKHNIQHLRLSSDMFPHFTDKETESYTLDFAIPYLEEAGEHCKKFNHRVTTHPSQFNQIGAKDENVFNHTVQDLKMHADMLDYMGAETEGTICIHGGGIYGDKDLTMRRWIENFSDLPANIRHRIAIENDEKCYSLRDCLVLSEAVGIPVIYDNLHHWAHHNHYNPSSPEEDLPDLLEDVVHSWKGDRIVCHIAEQSKEKSYVGAHSDFVEKIPDELISLMEHHDDLYIDAEVEAKSKEKAILELMGKYKGLF